MIKIANIRTFIPDGSIAIRVDRVSVLGNPFHMSNESSRDKVCDMYDSWFNKQIILGHYVFIAELDHILDICRYKDVTLLCWCYPKRCHGETIKKYLEERLNESTIR